ncbi:MAG: hypothetical protein M1827_006871 [Pycnora praestabilis]|nr:MAG: hypothetical protein M1827_006871 [Pycnora praestabilis]
MPCIPGLVELALPEEPRMGLRKTFFDRAALCHGRIPIVRKLPLSVVGIILIVVAVNVAVWVAVGIVLHFHGYYSVFSQRSHQRNENLTNSYRPNDKASDSFGTKTGNSRHVLFSGSFHVRTVYPFLGVKYISSLSYRIVVITSIVVAATAAAVSDRFGRFSKIGGIIGTSVSACFLIILGSMNMYILYKLVQQMKKILATRTGEEESFKIQGAGCLFHLFKKMFKLIDKPWKMYPLGVMFGLGFDTSSEIALLGIASIQAAKGTSIWLILIFPVLFTAGMCLLDTIDGALMMTIYTSTALARDQIAILYYSIVLTLVTVVVAMVIGVIQLLSLILNVAEPQGKFWDGVGAAGDHYDIVGGAICGSFILFGGLSILMYKPWRRRIDRQRQIRAQPEQLQDIDEEEEIDGGIVESPTAHAEPEIVEEDASLCKPREGNGMDHDVDLTMTQKAKALDPPTRA